MKEISVHNKAANIIKKVFYISFFTAFYMLCGFAVIWNYFGHIILTPFINSFDLSFSSLESRCRNMLICISFTLSAINLITDICQYMISKKAHHPPTIIIKALSFLKENSLYIASDIAIYIFLIAIPYIECGFPLGGLAGIIALKVMTAALVHGTLIPSKILEKLLNKFEKVVDGF